MEKVTLSPSSESPLIVLWAVILIEIVSWNTKWSLTFQNQIWWLYWIIPKKLLFTYFDEITFLVKENSSNLLLNRCLRSIYLEIIRTNSGVRVSLSINRSVLVSSWFYFGLSHHYYLDNLMVKCCPSSTRLIVVWTKVVIKSNQNLHSSYSYILRCVDEAKCMIMLFPNELYLNVRLELLSVKCAILILPSSNANTSILPFEAQKYRPASSSVV